jgi:hypothetical protein
MSKSDILKSVVKKVADKSTFGTNPKDPWSTKSGISEDRYLDKYLNTRGINPKFATRDIKIAHSKSNEFLNWKRSHLNVREDMTTDRETTDVRSKVAQSPTLKRKNELQKSVKHYIVKSPTGSMHKEDFTDEEVDMLINEVLGKDATAGDWIHDFIHSDNPKFKGKSRKERQRMALGAYYAKQNESLGDDFLQMMKDKGIKHRVHGTPDQEKQRTADKLAVNKAKVDAAPKPTKKDDQGGFGTHRGYGQGRYMGDSVELDNDTLINELSKEKLGGFIKKSKETFKDLPTEKKGNRLRNVIKAAIKKDAKNEEVDLDEAKMSASMKLSNALGREKAKSTASMQRAKEMMDKIKQDVKAKSEKPPIKEDRMKSARIIKSIYKKKNMKEEMYDHEKDDKGSSSVYGKAPKMGKSKEEAESTNKAAAILKGGTTLTGKSRDTVEIDPMMRVRPTTGSPEDTRSKKSIG